MIAQSVNWLAVGSTLDSRRDVALRYKSVLLQNGFTFRDARTKSDYICNARQRQVQGSVEILYIPLTGTVPTPRATLR
jgi:hypothetical protein